MVELYPLALSVIR